MKNTIAKSTLTLALGIASLALTPSATFAQLAGSSTTTGISISESTQVAVGWSVKKTLMGKSIYNEAGQKIGKIEDLIIAPDKNVSYVIVGAGGFIGIGRHDVAVPVTQIKDQAGKLVMAGGTVAVLKAMPAFDYAIDTSERDRFIARADKDIASAKSRLAALEASAKTASAEAKAKLDLQVTALRVDVKSAEAKLAEMKTAAAKQWKEFQASVDAATARLRKSAEMG